jgi:hypothetical protein
LPSAGLIRLRQSGEIRIGQIDLYEFDGGPDSTHGVFQRYDGLQFVVDASIPPLGTCIVSSSAYLKVQRRPGPAPNGPERFNATYTAARSDSNPISRECGRLPSNVSIRSDPAIDIRDHPKLSHAGSLQIEF